MINKTLSMYSLLRVGHLTADPAYSWEAGQVATLGSDGWKTVTVSGSEFPFGIFLNNHTSSLTRSVVLSVEGSIDAAAVDAAATLTLAHNNITNSGNKTTNASADFRAYTYVLGTTTVVSAAHAVDYDVNPTTGVVTAIAAGIFDSTGAASATIYSGTLLATYRYNMTVAEKEGFLDTHGNVVGGYNYQNQNEEVNFTGETTVAGEGSLVYTDQFEIDESMNFVLGSPVEATNDGKITLGVAPNQKLGRVIALPTATSPWLGVLVTAR
jgi:hypothetical protein